MAIPFPLPYSLTPVFFPDVQFFFLSLQVFRFEIPSLFVLCSQPVDSLMGCDWIWSDDFLPLSVDRPFVRFLFVVTCRCSFFFFSQIFWVVFFCFLVILGICLFFFLLAAWQGRQRSPSKSPLGFSLQENFPSQIESFPKGVCAGLVGFRVAYRYLGFSRSTVLAVPARLLPAPYSCLQSQLWLLMVLVSVISP